MDAVQQITDHMLWMRRLAARLLRDESAADDVVQETLLEAIREVPDTSRPLRPWLAAVLRNRFRMLSRSNQRRDRREAATSGGEGAPSPEELLELGDLQQRIAGAVQSLGEPLRATVLMRFHGGMSNAEIARHTRVPEGTVRRRLKDALDRLRDRLDDEQAARTPPWRRTPRQAG
jgi:RNA polymerase sigma-70 factor (ECF subfamily)